jgi:hypothetical protein
VHRVHAAAIRRLAHEPVDRAEAAIGQQLQVGQLPRIQHTLRQRRGFLFERARFSVEVLGEADRQAALEGLLAIQASLDARLAAAPAEAR